MFPERFFFFVCAGSLLPRCRLGCPSACGILLTQPGIEPTSLAWEGRFLLTGPPGKSVRLLFLKVKITKHISVCVSKRWKRLINIATLPLPHQKTNNDFIIANIQTVFLISNCFIRSNVYWFKKKVTNKFHTLWLADMSSKSLSVYRFPLHLCFLVIH